MQNGFCEESGNANRDVRLRTAARLALTSSSGPRPPSSPASGPWSVAAVRDRGCNSKKLDADRNRERHPNSDKPQARVDLRASPPRESFAGAEWRTCCRLPAPDADTA